MKAIRFSESELEFLKNHYELELVEAENYISEIKNILKKLGVLVKEAVQEKPVTKGRKGRGRPKKTEAIVTPKEETVKKRRRRTRKQKSKRKLTPKAIKNEKKATETTPAAKKETGKKLEV